MVMFHLSFQTMLIHETFCYKTRDFSVMQLFVDLNAIELMIFMFWMFLIQSTEFVTFRHKRKILSCKTKPFLRR